MSSMRKAAAGPLSLPRTQHGSKMVLGTCWGLAFLIVLAPAVGKARWRSDPFLHNPLRKEWDGEQRSSCLCSAGLCCPIRVSWRAFVGCHWGGWKPDSCAQEHPLSFPGRWGAAGAWQQLHDPAVINAVGPWLLPALPFPSCNPGELSISLTRE